MSENPNQSKVRAVPTILGRPRLQWKSGETSQITTQTNRLRSSGFGQRGLNQRAQDRGSGLQSVAYSPNYTPQTFTFNQRSTQRYGESSFAGSSNLQDRGYSSEDAVTGNDELRRGPIYYPPISRDISRDTVTGSDELRRGPIFYPPVSSDYSSEDAVTGSLNLSTLDKIKRFLLSEEEWEAYLMERLEKEKRQKDAVTRREQLRRGLIYCPPISRSRQPLYADLSNQRFPNQMSGRAPFRRTHPFRRIWSPTSRQSSENRLYPMRNRRSGPFIAAKQTQGYAQSTDPVSPLAKIDDSHMPEWWRQIHPQAPGGGY